MQATVNLPHGDSERELLAAHERLLAATALLARAQSRADVLDVIETTVRAALGFAAVRLLTRGDQSSGPVGGHAVALGDLTGVLVVDEPDGRQLSIATRLRVLRPFADTAGAVLSSVARLEASRAQARHDPLTRLPNRAALVERLGVAIACARRENALVAVLFIDLDGFKAVNDEFGHDTGDAVLRAVAGRLVEHVRPQDAVARFGGDEFVVICEEVADHSAAQAIAARLAGALGAPVHIGDTRVDVGASIGLVVGDGRSSPAQLLRDADAAMYLGKVNVRTKSPDPRARAQAPGPAGSSPPVRLSDRAASG
jgi:diguanylate cyclase (GGDEF)-like protein